MYAVLVSVSIDPERQDDAARMLETNVIPGVKEIPGAVAGYWLAPKDGHGYSTIVFETEDQAKGAAEGVGERAPEFVTIEHVEVREIVAHF